MPVAPGSTPLPPPRRSQGWIWWVVGGCAILLVLGAVGAGFGIYGLVTRFQSGAFSCLPSDFPKYPGASVVSENTSAAGDLSPGDSTQCTMILRSGDSVDAVSAFYQQNLNTGDWTIPPSHPPGDTYAFARKSRPETVGEVVVTAKGLSTEINIRLNT